eukprot:TRINITY_DN35211_c0_g1_i1.p1 TRINITY_DN35211_c0_g1~~TRINITY_DN35211_c0_g1_i1.p1  ORF type:complete len:298 (+),score=30.77 TRINITY_DN35211_c0_g1_i1:29-895(+)
MDGVVNDFRIQRTQRRQHRRTAAERRGQRLRAQGRVAQWQLRTVSELGRHRGGQPARLGATILSVLAASSDALVVGTGAVLSLADAICTFGLLRIETCEAATDAQDSLQTAGVQASVLAPPTASTGTQTMRQTISQASSSLRSPFGGIVAPSPFGASLVGDASLVKKGLRWPARRLKRSRRHRPLDLPARRPRLSPLRCRGPPPPRGHPLRHPMKVVSKTASVAGRPPMFVSRSDDDSTESEGSMAEVDSEDLNDAKPSFRFLHVPLNQTHSSVAARRRLARLRRSSQ